MGSCNLQISAILAYTLHKVEMGLVNFFLEITGQSSGHCDHDG